MIPDVIPKRRPGGGGVCEPGGEPRGGREGGGGGLLTGRPDNGGEPQAAELVLIIASGALVEVGVVGGSDAPLLQTALMHEARRALAHARRDQLAELLVGRVRRRDLVEADATCPDLAVGRRRRWRGGCGWRVGGGRRARERGGGCAKAGGQGGVEPGGRGFAVHCGRWW